MGKRKKYRDMTARFLYEHTKVNQRLFQVQASWQEAQKALDSLGEEMKKKLPKRSAKKEEKTAETENKE